MKIFDFNDDKVNIFHFNSVQIHTSSSHINFVQIHTLSLFNLFDIRVFDRQNIMIFFFESKFLSAFASFFLTSLLHHEVSSFTDILFFFHRSATIFFESFFTRHEIRFFSRHLTTIFLFSDRRFFFRRSTTIKFDLFSKKRKCHNIQFLSRRLTAISFSDNRFFFQRSASISDLFSSTQKRKSVSQINFIMFQYMTEIAAAHYINEFYD